MSLAIVYSRAASGIQAPLVTVEAHLSYGTVGFHIVGVPAVAVKESRDRVRSAILNTQFEFPIRRITVNLAPADLPKEGGRFDLPIALGILAASQQIPKEVLAEYEFVGELALSGELRPVRGVLPIVIAAQQSGRTLIVPQANAAEAALVQQATVLSAQHILEVCAHLTGKKSLPKCTHSVLEDTLALPDLADVKGQYLAKRALEVAAAGEHNLLYIGPPGTGKTMLASRITSILPELNEEAALEVAAVASVSSGGFTAAHWRRVPFRAPHHSSSSAALAGGGRPPRPGEISLAHHGVLFLDELPEFNRPVLECLREPLESGMITISRAAYQTTFPAQFQFIAAMNPCPCGYAGTTEACRCSSEHIARYMNKISGPLLDRIDMHVEVAKLSPEFLLNTRSHTDEKSASVKERILRARLIQNQRQGKPNHRLSVSELDEFSNLQISSQRLLEQVMTKFNFSARVYHRIIKVARTIADLESSSEITTEHISEVLQYRCLDKNKALNY